MRQNFARFNIEKPDIFMKLEYDPLMVRRKVVLGTFKQFLLEKNEHVNSDRFSSFR